MPIRVKPGSHIHESTLERELHTQKRLGTPLIKPRDKDLRLADQGRRNEDLQPGSSSQVPPTVFFFYQGTQFIRRPIFGWEQDVAPTQNE
jgi:hypothetical protein